MAETEEKTEDALDERFKTRLEAELSAAHTKIGEQNETIAMLIKDRDRVTAERTDNLFASESLFELRQEHRKAQEEIARLRAGQDERRLKARIQGLESALDQAEAKVSKLEEELARYRASDERVQQAKSVFDLAGV